MDFCPRRNPDPSACLEGSILGAEPGAQPHRRALQVQLEARINARQPVSWQRDLQRDAGRLLRSDLTPCSTGRRALAKPVPVPPASLSSRSGSVPKLKLRQSLIKHRTRCERSGSSGIPFPGSYNPPSSFFFHFPSGLLLLRGYEPRHFLLPFHKYCISQMQLPRAKRHKCLLNKIM